jgi:hypothetical protein
VKKYPNDAIFVGLAEKGPRTICVSIAIAAGFFRVKHNTINRNLRRAGYKESSDPHCRCELFPNLPGQGKWSTRVRVDRQQDVPAVPNLAGNASLQHQTEDPYDPWDMDEQPWEDDERGLE